MTAPARLRQLASLLVGALGGLALAGAAVMLLAPETRPAPAPVAEATPPPAIAAPAPAWGAMPP